MLQEKLDLLIEKYDVSARAELKGTALACVIGLSVYAAVVRTVCIVPGQDGEKYVSRLPRLKRRSVRRGRKEKDDA